MKLVIFILFAFQTCIIGQTLDQDYELLAKYSILKYTLEKTSLGNTESLSSTIADVENLIKNNNYRYIVDSVCSFDNYQIICITDENNFQFHGSNFSVYAIDTTETFGNRYYFIDRDKYLDFINNKLYKYPKKSSGRYKLIEVYNALFKCFHRNDCEIMFYNQDNKSRFQYLNKRNLLDDVMKDIGGYIYNIFYITNINNDIEYWTLIYSFKKDKMEVEKYLEYRIIPEEEQHINPEH